MNRTRTVANRGWVDLQALITRSDEPAIVAECERGGMVAVKNYERALRRQLPSEVRGMVELQYQGVRKNRERVRRLKESVAWGRARAA